jgi:hypothetical protein
LQKIAKCLQPVPPSWFTTTKLFADPEFEALRPWFPCLDTCGANDHIPDIERFIRTEIQEEKYLSDVAIQIHSTHSTHTTCEECHFLVEFFPSTRWRFHNNVTKMHHDWTGGNDNKHMRLEFGEYVQTHKEHDNAMTDRTISAICLGLTGNECGTHWFMHVASGA